MSKRSTMYKGTPRDSTRKHQIRELAHMHNVEQRGFKYPKSINIHNYGDQASLIAGHFNISIIAEQARAKAENRPVNQTLITRIKRQAERAGMMLQRRFFKREVGSCYDPHQGKKECLRRLRRAFGNVYLSYIRDTYPTAAQILEANGLVEPPFGGDDDDQNHSFITPWPTGVREDLEMILVSGV